MFANLGKRFFGGGLLRYTNARYFSAINVGNINASGPPNSPAPVRNDIIGSFLSANSPHLMFFQEFTTRGPLTKKWAPYELKASYRYYGSSQSSILYDSEALGFSELSEESVDILEKNDIVSSRLCICILEDKVDKIKFIAASWHGPHKETEMNKLKLLQELNGILSEVQKQEGIDQLILSGDFNLEVEKASTVVPKAFKIHKYEKGVVRGDKDVIDFYITNAKFPLEGLGTFDVDKVDIKEILDHDISTGVANLGIGTDD